MAEKRIYEVWKGNNKFLFSGWLIFGPDVRSLLLTIFLIVAPIIIFFVLIAGDLLNEFSSYSSGIVVMVVAVMFTMHVLVLLLVTSGRDPGIIPRSPYPPEPEDVSGMSPADWVGGGQTPRLRICRTKDVEVNGTVVKVKYCDTCMLYRPPRCSHCSICNNCVERFDHHCPWVGQCIGQRNYRFFFMFVFSATLLCIYVFYFSALLLKFLMKGNGGRTRTVWEAIMKSPASLVLMIYTFIAVWFVGGLTIFHLYLISTNQTTYENFCHQYDSRQNPYHLGLIRNFYEIFCTPIQPSRNHFRERVSLDLGEESLSGFQTETSVKVQALPVESGGNKGNMPIYVGSGVKQYELDEDASAQAFKGHPFPTVQQCGDSQMATHPRWSSCGRRSGSWEITPDVSECKGNNLLYPESAEEDTKPEQS